VKIAYLHNHPEHLEKVAVWLFNQWGHLSEGASIDRSVSKLRVPPANNGIPLSLIAVEDDMVYGVARIVENDMDIRPLFKPWLASVYVVPEHRHKEIGRKLCKAAIDEARKLSCDFLYLFTPDKALYYTKLGWKLVEKIGYRNENVFVMCHESS
jgi:predicted N-acetyltransferase YhbS